MLNRRRMGILLVALSPLVGWGCGWFEDPTPEYLRLQSTGPAGAQARVKYTTQFVAAVNEQGVTVVEVSSYDELLQTLPVHTTIYIGIDRRFFAEVTPVSASSMTLQVKVDVDDRTQINESGVVEARDPFRFAYLFNQRLTRLIDVVL